MTRSAVRICPAAPRNGLSHWDRPFFRISWYLNCRPHARSADPIIHGCLPPAGNIRQFESTQQLQKKSLKPQGFMFIGTQCDLWGRPDGTGHEKISRGKFPRLTFSLIPRLSERQCSNRIYVSCEASNPHGLPKVPLILTSGLELYQDTIKTHLCRSKIQKLNAMRQHIRVLQCMALRLSG